MIGIINPRSGNITSVSDCLERLERKHVILDEPQTQGIDQLLLPGQGRFGTVMGYLEQYGWVDFLKQWHAAGKSLVGICAGMQVMFEASEEDPGVEGLGLLPGTVTRLESPKQPMIGWARVNWNTADYPRGAAYFVNSYVVRDSEAGIGYTNYGMRFCCAVARDSLYAFQFHPEKSGAWGKELLEQCLIS